jgi:hypothetical protein
MLREGKQVSAVAVDTPILLAIFKGEPKGKGRWSACNRRRIGQRQRTAISEDTFRRPAALPILKQPIIDRARCPAPAAFDGCGSLLPDGVALDRPIRGPGTANCDLKTCVFIIDMQTDFCGMGGMSMMGYDLSLTRAPIKPTGDVPMWRAPGAFVMHTREGHRVMRTSGQQRWRSRRIGAGIEIRTCGRILPRRPGWDIIEEPARYGRGGY